MKNNTRVKINSSQPHFAGKTGIIRQKLRIDYHNTGFDSMKYNNDGPLYVVQLDKMTYFKNGAPESLVIFSGKSLDKI